MRDHQGNIIPTEEEDLDDKKVVKMKLNSDSYFQTFEHSNLLTFKSIRHLVRTLASQKYQDSFLAALVKSLEYQILGSRGCSPRRSFPA